MTESFGLSGLIAAAFTPMNSDASLNPRAVPEIVDFVLGQGADGLFVCGSTGEGTSLTIDERMTITEAFARAINDRVPLVAHVGHNCLDDVRTLARHASRIGVSAIAASAPSYFRPASVAVLVDCLASVAEVAPETPFFYYHIPALTGVDLRMVELLEQVADRIPTFAGIKFSSRHLDDLQQCVEFDHGRYNILFGIDEMLLAGLATGVQGAVGSTYNYLAPVYRQILESIKSGDLHAAREHQLKATRVVRVILTFGGLNALKAAMAILGVDCGPTRLPIPPLDAPSCREMRDAIEDTLGEALSARLLR